MSTSITIKIEDHIPTIFGRVTQPTRTVIAVTRDTKGAAILAALAAMAAANKDDIVRAWDELRAQVEPLLAAAEAAQAETAQAEPDAAATP
ncbi:hypothetical protein ABZ671_00695 [Micromonospora sp. NPDC006766]|uniref:hypothetical protein n=1 Tax=Micromonospora sp. NPDC006766 TaxID=3154778 RepID=UPI00341085CF